MCTTIRAGFSYSKGTTFWQAHRGRWCPGRIDSQSQRKWSWPAPSPYSFRKWSGQRTCRISGRRPGLLSAIRKPGATAEPSGLTRVLIDQSSAHWQFDPTNVVAVNSQVACCASRSFLLPQTEVVENTWVPVGSFTSQVWHFLQEEVEAMNALRATIINAFFIVIWVGLSHKEKATCGGLSDTLRFYLS